MFRKLAVALLVCALVPLSASALDNEEMLALVAMPLAVAAVSEITDVPINELVDVVTLMNDAAVPPTQFIEVVRYAPVALVVEDDEPDFVEFVRVQRQQGLAGTALVNSIEDRIRVYGVPDVELDVTASRIVDVDSVEFIPAVVRTRVDEVRRHPHGGPPGQLKKQIGVQTGAEIVHGSRVKPRKVKVDNHQVGRGNGKGKVDGNGKGKGHGNGKKGGGGGKGKGNKG